MKRREVITLLGGAAHSPSRLRRSPQQSAEPTRRIGVLMETGDNDPERTKEFARFKDRLASLGWVEGRTVHFDYRFAAAQGDQFPTLAKELVALQPNVVFAVSTPAVAAVQRETRTIPIVFLGTSDPNRGLTTPLWRSRVAAGIGLVRLVLEPPWHERFVAADNVKFLLVLTRRQVIFQMCHKSEVDHEHQQRHFDTLH